MTGSSLAPIVIPIVAAIALAVWLTMIFYAAAHPEWKAHPASSRPHETGTKDRPETGPQATPERAAAAAAHSTDAVEHGMGERGQPPPARAA